MNIINKVTLKGLKSNKVRTIVTIIGIILSAAMITAVTTLVSSMQNYLVNLTIAEEGNWHAAVHNISYEDFENLKNMDEIHDAVVTRAAGYSLLEGGNNEYKPYLYLLELGKEAFDTLPVHITKGRLPNNENEVVVSNHIRSNSGVSLEIGDTLEFRVGQRVTDDGSVLNQKTPFVFMEDGTSEKLEVKGTRTLTIVGEMSRLSYRLEGYSAPGYTILTLKDFSELASNEKQMEKDLSIYFNAENHRKVYETEDKIAEAFNIGRDQFEENSELLRYMGVSNHDNFNAVLYSLGAILITLIMVGSISLIYNSFSISVSERTKQFGLLSSVGATSKQITHSVFFEALILAVIGIPLGVLAGICGIGVTLYFISELFASFIYSAVHVPFTLSVSTLSVIAAVLTALITILISAYIPSRRSAKVTAVEAIRQTADIKLKAKQVKTSWFTRKLIGIEGDFALKNIKRNNKRYRSTVISLFISVVLFVSASAFSMYLRDSVTNVYEAEDYDLYHYTSGRGKPNDSTKEVYDDILALNSVKQGSSITTIYFDSHLSKEQVQESYYEDNIRFNGGKDIHVSVSVKSVDHDTFTEYIHSLGLEESQFIDSNHLTGVVVDNQHYYDYEINKFMNKRVFHDRSIETLSLEYPDYIEGAKKLNPIEVKIAAFEDTAPFGSNDYADRGTILLIVDQDASQNLFVEEQDVWIAQYMHFAADDPYKAEIDINEILDHAGLDKVVNIHQMVQENENSITIISVFSYGFIILISLITIANVFNTISTNVNLRRREFAMLKSVGMTDSSFNKMLNFECILYGLKGLLYGLPVSIFITYLIYRSIGQGVVMRFYLPVSGILISVFSVFLVVFISMMYSMNKIRNENILDALKSESL